MKANMNPTKPKPQTGKPSDAHTVKPGEPTHSGYHGTKQTSNQADPTKGVPNKGNGNAPC